MPLTSRSQSCPELNLEGLGDKEGELRKFLVVTPFKNQQDFLAMLKSFSDEELKIYYRLLVDQSEYQQAQAQETQVGGAQVAKGAEGRGPSLSLSLAAQLTLTSTELQKREAELEAQSAPTPFPLSQ
ncbi:hypothetical protein PsalN5692_03090 [Piscirickettsia salmonis]|uniref:hypothetical protein n=1 Tax=Piscirickettsia salmonis TaxID=1238 RepID=UPI0012B83C84|nr:hypothetical protein [Piscirickettsia salmonis]QGP51604.1 hypothetical protein PsalN5692_03090 [Piscirickettsia salmonis]QGP53180.1 hypothetical protein PsalSR1_00586 [Piscirickettsia salmonis]QGP60883.1 hypothetical protein PsalBI1_03505 [Piscirickettsia salmonis]QGP62749.1 hypothetical protein PsalMR5_00587 [Piscirickettsia salmonis]